MKDTLSSAPSQTAGKNLGGSTRKVNMGTALYGYQKNASIQQNFMNSIPQGEHDAPMQMSDKTKTTSLFLAMTQI